MAIDLGLKTALSLLDLKSRRIEFFRWALGDPAICPPGRCELESTLHRVLIHAAKKSDLNLDLSSFRDDLHTTKFVVEIDALSHFERVIRIWPDYPTDGVEFQVSNDGRVQLLRELRGPV